MLNSAISQAARKKSISNMLAMLRIENLSPSASLKHSLHAYIEGQKTTTDLLNEAKTKFKAQLANQKNNF